MIGRIAAAIRSVLHLCYEFYILQAVLLLLSSAVGGLVVWWRSGEISAKISKGDLLAVIAAEFLGLLIGIAIFLSWRQRVNSDFKAVTTSENILDGKLQSTECQIIQLQQRENRRASVQGGFRVFAEECSRCDVLIFEYLFFRSGGLERVPRQDIEMARTHITTNVENILRDLASILTFETGHPCATSVKLLERQADVAPSDWPVQTVARDPNSRAARPLIAPLPPNRVKDNSANVHIILNGFDHYCSDDLMALQKLVQYNNSYGNFYQHYNATMVVPIPMFAKTEDPVLIHGLLCADNLSGGLANDTCKRYMQQFAYRLTAMYHRIDRLAAR